MILVVLGVRSLFVKGSVFLLLDRLCYDAGGDFLFLSRAYALVTGLLLGLLCALGCSLVDNGNEDVLDAHAEFVL